MTNNGHDKATRVTLNPTRRYETLLRINNAIVQQTTRESLFQALSNEIYQLIEYDRFSINLYDHELRSLSYFASAKGVSLGGKMTRPLEKGLIAQTVIRTKEPLIIPDVKNQSYFSNMNNMIEAGLNVTMGYPLIVRDTVLGSLHFSFKNRPDNLDEVNSFFEDLSPQVAIAVYNILAHNRLKRLNESLKNEKKFLKKEAHGSFDPENFFYKSESMSDVMQQVKNVAASDAPVLITGETGTGKEYIAHCIHHTSLRSDALLVKVNCPALASSLFESELFGHTKGAFTGASQQRIGRFEMANNGTIFLDEIAELPMPQQAKILHVLQDRCFERVGESRSISADFRIVAATNKDLLHAIHNESFRSDLYYRLNTAQIHIPSLRERPEDIPVLVINLSDQISKRLHRPSPKYSDKVLESLCQYPWPGNVRELKNFVHRMFLQRSAENVKLSDVKSYLGNSQEIEYNDNNILPMHEMEKQHIVNALRICKGVLSGENGAASLLQMKRSTLQYRLKRHNINPSDYKAF
ncbi:sigma-54-dependent Fis family transcriptional regulator [Desulfohalobium retbaense]|uniref:Transcriptional regulator, NifA subfamily, Fis Family n=1 Tax=Desulfohalobium retbaense (strain ATCC 49708 / DSM 5692 / JCM 16813 / HR100) TaxID=485915 RepID=C8X5B4_DESRD|nr:sigma 54-interacting transcriptional regulator [Desulfohalobium retbaense]ACV69611.1 transcriptional regulator, NifA subfamily, Fis Family [Desulfohalobium retbaense DSM 5692]